MAYGMTDDMTNDYTQRMKETNMGKRMISQGVDGFQYITRI